MMKYLPVLQLVTCCYALFLALLLDSPDAAGFAMRADLTHVDSGRGFTKWELLNRMASRSRARAARLCQSGPGGGTHPGGGAHPGGGTHPGGGGGAHPGGGTHPGGGGGAHPGGGTHPGSGGGAHPGGGGAHPGGGTHPGGGGVHPGAAHPATAPVAPGTIGDTDGEYLIHLSIGTPRAQPVALVMDTGSSLIWAQCGPPCYVCFDQLLPLFNPSESKTHSVLLCNDPLCAGFAVSACLIPNRQCYYIYFYGDKSITAGQIIRDTFIFKAPDGKGGTVPAPNLVFGCGVFNKGTYSNNETGIAGFGRGPHSLPSQLRVGNFSHCFTSKFGSGQASPMFLGTPDDLTAHAMGPIKSTPLLSNRVRPNLYYLSFKGITVGETRLPIHESVFALKSDGSGGTIIDSGTGITAFPTAVYEQIHSAFVSQIHLPVLNASESGGKLCFSLPNKGEEDMKLPRLVFHLAGADMELPEENYMMVYENGICLIINGYDGDLTLIGNYQQQNMHIVYDVGNNKLLFAPAECDKM